MLVWILVVATVLAALAASMSLGLAAVERHFAATVAAEFARQPLQPAVPLQGADLAHLPAAVQRYITASGAVGQPRVQNLRITFDARMQQSATSRPMPSRTLQFNFVAEPARHFYLRTRMFGIPTRVVHSYSQARATMRVHLAGLIKVVDIAGPALSATETATLLNDLCLFAPGALVDPRLAWRELGPRQVEVSFRNAAYAVKAVLSFDEQDRLVDFVCADRGELQRDGSLLMLPWSTPLRDHRMVRGHRLPGYGEAVFLREHGRYAYGRFTLLDVEYNVPAPGPGQAIA
jgi:hypothetical protein